MKKIIQMLIVVTTFIGLNADKYAGEIFRMGAGVRNFALGHTGVSDFESPAIVYWNASLLEKSNSNKITAMHSEEFDGLFKYDVVTAIWGNETKMGLVFSRIGIDDIPQTKLENPDLPVSIDNRPYKYKTFSDQDYLLYFGLSRKISNKIVLGITPKIAFRKIASENGFGFGADLSSYLEFNKHLLVGARLHDFFSTQIFWSTDEHEIVNPGLDIESNLSFELPLLKKPGRIFTGIDLLTEGREESAQVSLDPISFDFHAGLAINVFSFLNLYSGYNSDFLTAGMGLTLRNWNIDYAFEHNPDLDNSQRVSLGYSFL